MDRDTKTTWAITTCSLAYATVRYNVFKGVPWSDWPIYIVNKAVALSSLLVLLAWILRARHNPEHSPTSLLNAAYRLILVHAVLSLALLTPTYFPAFFLDGRLTWQAGLSVLVGVLAAGGLHFNSRSRAPRHPGTVAVGVVAFMAGLHATLYGYGSWLTPSTWPGHMFPITMISGAAGIAALAAALRMPPAGRAPGR